MSGDEKPPTVDPRTLRPSTDPKALSDLAALADEKGYAQEDKGFKYQAHADAWKMANENPKQAIYLYSKDGKLLASCRDSIAEYRPEVALRTLAIGMTAEYMDFKDLYQLHRWVQGLIEATQVLPSRKVLWRNHSTGTYKVCGPKEHPSTPHGHGVSAPGWVALAEAKPAKGKKWSRA